MAEENNTDDTPALTPDDAEALRFILHQVRGISPVSMTLEYIPSDDEPKD